MLSFMFSLLVVPYDLKVADRYQVAEIKTLVMLDFILCRRERNAP